MDYPVLSQSFIGRLSKIKVPITKPFLPLYEAISNSFDSIEQNEVGGSIRVTVLRDDSQTSLEGQSQSNDVIGFIIWDDGIGLNRENFEDSFLICDSTKKLEFGGKGIGRFTWVKCFKHVDVESVYVEGSKKFKRSMSICDDDKFFKSYSNSEIDGNSLGTSIFLKFFKEGYNKYVDKTTSVIADKIISHFMPIMLTGGKRIKFLLEDCGEVHDLNAIFEETHGENTHIYDFIISENKFNVHILKSSSARENKNKVFFCGHRRAVVSKGLELFSRYVVAANIYYSCYVTGDFLDSHVSDDRCNFSILPKSDVVTGCVVGWDEIESGTQACIESFMNPLTNAARESHKKSVSDYVQRKNPRYRALLNSNPEISDKIPLNPSDDQIISVLEVENQRKRITTNESISKVLKDQSSDLESRKKKIFDLIRETYKSGRDILADYMFERRATLDMLRELITINQDGSFSLEGDVHSLIFPMGMTSENVEYDEHNLWVIDERLAFHRSLTSDLPVSSSMEVESRLEPDILCYVEEPIGTHNYFSSATIIEFKRPGKPGKHKDPIAQVKETVLDLQEGKKTVEGRKIHFRDGSHFFGYIITELDAFTMRKIKMEGYLLKTPDGGGYFGYNADLNLYLEIVSYDKLLSDAEKRNQILFHKLGIGS